MEETLDGTSLFTLRWVSALIVEVANRSCCSLEILFTLSRKLVFLMGVDLSCRGSSSDFSRDSFLIIIFFITSWNIVHSCSAFDYRFLSGRCRKDLIVIACEKSLATVTIFSSAVILG